MTDESTSGRRSPWLGVVMGAVLLGVVAIALVALNGFEREGVDDAFGALCGVVVGSLVVFAALRRSLLGSKAPKGVVALFMAMMWLYWGSMLVKVYRFGPPEGHVVEGKARAAPQVSVEGGLTVIRYAIGVTCRLPGTWNAVGGLPSSESGANWAFENGTGRVTLGLVRSRVANRATVDRLLDLAAKGAQTTARSEGVETVLASRTVDDKTGAFELTSPEHAVSVRTKLIFQKLDDKGYAVFIGANGSSSETTASRLDACRVGEAT